MVQRKCFRNAWQALGTVVANAIWNRRMAGTREMETDLTSLPLAFRIADAFDRKIEGVFLREDRP